MAFLLLLHEKMRLQRKVNKLRLRQTQSSSRKERVANKITKVQKMYSNKISMLDKSAQMWTSQFKNSILNQAGLGAQNQMFNPMGGYGLTSFVVNQIGGLLANGVPVGAKDADGKPTNVKFSQDEYQKLMNEYCSGTLSAYKDKDGVVQKGKYGANGDITEEQYKAFMMSLQQAQSNQSQAQFMCQQMSSQYESNVSIWIEAQKAQLEEEQQAALLPLEALDTELELENNGIAAELEYAKAQLEAYNSELKEAVRDSAPKFGLG